MEFAVTMIYSNSELKLIKIKKYTGEAWRIDYVTFA